MVSTSTSTSRIWRVAFVGGDPIGLDQAVRVRVPVLVHHGALLSFDRSFGAIALAHPVCSRLFASANRAHDHARADGGGTHRPDVPIGCGVDERGDRTGVLYEEDFAQTRSWRRANVAAAVRDSTPSLARMLVTWLRTVLWLMKSARGDLRVGVPLHEQLAELPARGASTRSATA